MAYWALKTRQSNDDGSFPKDADKWEYFFKNQIIAIGWGKIDISPNNNPLEKDIRDALKKIPAYGYLEKPPRRVASFIWNFINLTEDDNILICRGYAYRGETVRLYGTAKVKGKCVYKDQIKNWDCFIRKAKVERFNDEGETYIPKEDLIRMFDGNRYFVGTLLKITKEQYESVVEWVKQSPKKY